jgi:hypothetical protein
VVVISIRVEVICTNADGDEQRRQVLLIERNELAMETLGMNLNEGKALLAASSRCTMIWSGDVYVDTAAGYTPAKIPAPPISTVSGRVELPNPRWKRCACQSEGAKTFRPIRSWLNGQTSPEMLYLETKWASLIPFARVADLLKEVLPVADSVNPETVRNHLYAR